MMYYCACLIILVLTTCILSACSLFEVGLTGSVKSGQKSMAFNLEEVKNHKGLKIIHINARSLLNHFDEFHAGFLDDSFDLVIFTESWLHANCADSLVNANGYTLHRLDREILTRTGSVKKGGGITIYVKNEFNVSSWPNLKISDNDIEALSLSCKLGNRKRVNLTAVYRPPGGNVQAALGKLETIVSTIRQSTSGDTTIVGDFNVDVLSENIHSKKISQFVNTCRLEQLIKTPTRISDRSRSLIDHIYTNSPHHSNSGTVNCNITDHFPVFCIIKK